MAKHAEKLVATNGKSDTVKVLQQRVEEVELEERVDVLISEPLGSCASPFVFHLH